MFLYRNNVFFILMFCGFVATGQKNIFKTGLTGALLGDIGLAFESAITENSSMQLKAGYLEPTLSPFLYEKVFTPKGYNFLKANGGINASAEFRFYLSNKGSMQGFYFAPYARYFNQSMLFEDEIESFLFNVDAKSSTFGTGIQLGYQWIFNERITLDFYFFGAGIDFYNAVIIYELEQKLPEFDYAIVTPYVDEVFEDIGFLRNKTKHEINPNNHTTRLPFLFPGIRMGISVGIAL